MRLQHAIALPQPSSVPVSPFRTFRRNCRRRDPRQTVRPADRRIVQRVHLLKEVRNWSARSLRGRTAHRPSRLRLRRPDLGQRSHRSTQAMAAPVDRDQRLQHLSNTLEGHVPPLLLVDNP